MKIEVEVDVRLNPPPPPWYTHAQYRQAMKETLLECRLWGTWNSIELRPGTHAELLEVSSIVYTYILEFRGGSGMHWSPNIDCIPW